MKKIKNYAFNEQARRFITYIIFIIFSIYTLSKLIVEPTLAGKVSYSLLLLVFIGIAAWSEYLRILYQRMIRSLTMDCNPSVAKHYYNSIKKKDFFQSYKQTLYVFDTLYYQDINKNNECINIIEQHEKIFKSSLDYLLIKNYTYFYTYYRIDNKSKVKKYYPEVIKLKDAKIKGTKISPLYNWEFIDALYLFSIKDYKKSLNAFKSVNSKNMNQRENAQLYLEYGKLYIELNEPVKAKDMLEKCISYGNQLVYAKDAKQLLNKI